MAWMWRGNQLCDPERQLTLLRDITFWNVTDEQKATIAAAPDMLIALQRALPFIVNDESPGGCDGKTPGCEHCEAIARMRSAIAKAETV
jgi:hypothetical protein